ncbi:RNase J family beta-CASP ribonuclease [Patescibacteria group bacterium]|nr:RNase J family beta-CASP ribonuclease [Patescibacteria group bacterium]
MNPSTSSNTPSSSGSGFPPYRPGINRSGTPQARPMRSRFPKPAPFLRSNPTQPLNPNTPRIVPATPAPVAGAPIERPRVPGEGMTARPAQPGSRPGGPSRGGKPMRGGKRGGPGSDLPNVRMHTFKNKPTHKTGSDEDTLSATGEQRLKVVVLGGNEEIGRNMSMIEYGNDIILIDMGLQFPDEDMPGVDYIIPNVSYLKGKEKNIRGVIITHAHMDHIGGIPHIMPQIGNPPIFSSDLTCAIIKKRQEDFRQCPPLNLHAVKYDDVIQLGVFKIEFLGVAHSVPTSMGIIINTPCGIIVHTGDFKLEMGEKAGSVQETEKMRQLGERGVLGLMIDSTNATQSGRQLTEIDIQHNLDEIIQNAKGKVIISTFASMIGRIQQIVYACERMGRKVAILGFSMSSNMTIAQQLGYFVAQKGTLIEPRDIHKYPREKVAIVCTGAQAQEGSALIRIANHEHPIVTLEPGDSIVFSSSVIPGNERTVQRLKDTLYREGANVVHYAMMDVHAGGHARQEDLIEVHQMIKPKYLIPIEANYSMLCEHANAAVRGGFKRENILIADNGQVMEFDQSGTGMLTNKKLPTDYVFVDGLGVGNTNEIVLRDRKQLAQDGVVLVVAVIDSRTGAPQALPDIISRGFVYMKEHQELITHARNKVASILRDMDPRSRTQTNYLKDKLRDDLGQFLFVKTEQRPMIIPVIIEV